jgi:hypothetical protein
MPKIPLLLVLAVLCSSISSAFGAATETRVRKHVEDMSAAEWDVLGKAILALHKLDKFDGAGRSVFPQGADSHERFVQIHGDFRENGACLHGSEDVWFWHRAFLLHFENRLRATNPPESSNITLPYWDWTEVASGNAGYPSAYEQTGSPLFHDRIQHARTAHSLSPLAVARDMKTDGAPDFVAGLLKDSDWGSFGGTIQGPQGQEGTLESDTHDLIHGSYIGLDNRSPKLSVRDPIFWAHHANLDRLVDRWQSENPKSKQCIECDSLVYDRDDQAGPIKVSQVLTNESVNGVKIIYQPRTSRVAQASRREDLAAEPVDDNTTAQKSVYRLTIPGQIERGTLVIPKLAVKSDNFYRVDVYLFPEAVEFKPDRSFKEQYRVGVVGSFAAGHANEKAFVGGRGRADPRTTVDLSAAFRKLPPSEVGKPYLLVMQFVPQHAEANLLSLGNQNQDVSHGAPELAAEGSTGKQTLSLQEVGGTK